MEKEGAMSQEMLAKQGKQLVCICTNCGNKLPSTRVCALLVMVHRVVSKTGGTEAIRQRLWDDFLQALLDQDCKGGHQILPECAPD